MKNFLCRFQGEMKPVYLRLTSPLIEREWKNGQIIETEIPCKFKEMFQADQSEKEHIAWDDDGPRVIAEHRKKGCWDENSRTTTYFTGKTRKF